MNRREFSELVAYIRNRPDEARRLREVLGEIAQQQPKIWISADKAGAMIGKSGKWIRTHIDLFPTAKQVAYGNGFAWQIAQDEVATQYNVYKINNP